MSNTVSHSPGLRIPVVVFLIAVVLVPLVYPLHVNRPATATLPDLLTAVHDKRPDWRPVRISASARELYLLAPNYRQDEFFPPTRNPVHLPRWRGLVHVQKAPRVAPLSEGTHDFERDGYFLRFGELELFGDPDMLHEIVALQPGR